MKVGLRAARIEDIAHASGLSKGAFYLHFESKEALFRELVLALQASFEVVRASREKAYRALLGTAPKRGDPQPFLAKLMEIDGREDRALLALLWDWRDVTDVLLRGSQGTEFSGIIWAMLDREVERVEAECVVLERVGVMRDDVPAFVIGSMIVGTYLMIARRLSLLSEKPAFEPLVAALQSVLADGIAPRPIAAAKPTKARRS